MSARKGAIPSRVGGWKIVDFVGAGGQASVFLGKKQQLNGTVLEAAIKLIPLDASSAKAAQLLAHESDVLQKLDNPHVARVLDGGYEEFEGGKFAWLATELIKGDDLETEIRKFGPLSKQQWLELAFDLFSGISAAHEEGVIHCDIKPGNILRDSRKTVLIDFGYASFVRISDPGDVMASTPGYQAPEQLDGEINPEDYEYPVDLFSLGVTLVYAGTGWLPWDLPKDMLEARQELEAVMKDGRSGVRARQAAVHEYRNAVSAYLKQLTTTNPRLDGLDADQVRIVAPLLKANARMRGNAADTLRQIQELLPEGSSRKTGKSDYASRKAVSPGSMKNLSAKAILQDAKQEIVDGFKEGLQSGKEQVANKAVEKLSEVTAAPKSFSTALKLSAWLGFLGADRFYLGKYGSAILKLGTYGGYGIWWYLDAKHLLQGKTKDKFGRELENQPEDLAPIRRKVRIISLITIPVAIASLATMSYFGGESLKELHPVPSVVGLNLSDAKSMLLDFEVLTFDASGSARKVIDDENWRVCSQDPRYGKLNGIDPLTLRVVQVEEDCP